MAMDDSKTPVGDGSDLFSRKMTFPSRSIHPLESVDLTTPQTLSDVCKNRAVFAFCFNGSDQPRTWPPNVEACQGTISTPCEFLVRPPPWPQGICKSRVTWGRQASSSCLARSWRWRPKACSIL